MSNVIPPRWIGFALRIVPIIERGSGWVHSWGRSRQRNDDLPGSSADSEHLRFCAVDVGFYEPALRDHAYKECYAQDLHGYKRTWTDPVTGRQVWGFHMQDRPGSVPPGG